MKAVATAIDDSLRGQVARWPQKEQDAWFKNLTRKDAERLKWDWRFWGRGKQFFPEGDLFGFLIRAGRGSGKSRAGAEWVIQRAKDGYSPIALIGKSKADVRDVMIEVSEGSILRRSPPWFYPQYEPSKRRLTWPNGSVAVVYSGDEPDQLRGPQHATAWFDELSKFRYAQETWDNTELGLRLSDRPQVMITTTPRPLALLRKLSEDPAIREVVASSFENRANLSERFMERILDKYGDTTLGEQELYGQLLEQAAGALWQRKVMIEDLRISEVPPLIRIVVAIDPATTSKTTSDETGIVVCGIDDNEHGYCLDDISGRYSPQGWASKAVQAFHKRHGDRIVGESNQGGEMVEETIRQVDRNVPVTLIHASESKRARAEPVAALAEQGRLHHVGLFELLEDELCNWEPGSGPSPNHLDAYVWSFTELFELGEKPKRSIRVF